MAKAIETKQWFPNLDKAIGSGALPAFPTKAAASKAARACGWPVHDVLPVQRRFERVWIVAHLDHLFTDTIAGVDRQQLHVPLQRYEEKNGIKRQPVVIFRRVINAA